jgi:hypothetical protein
LNSERSALDDSLPMSEETPDANIHTSLEKTEDSRFYLD